MIIAQGSAESFLRMFHGQQDEISIAILILSMRRKEAKLFHALIDGLTEVDHALGSEIGLFLFYPNSEAALEAWDHGTTLISGERFSFDGKRPVAMGAREFFHASTTPNDEFYRRQIREIVTSSSAEIVSDFCTIFNISQTELPCVCTIIKGLAAPILSRTGERLSYSRLVQAAHAIRNELEQVRVRAHLLTEDLPTLRRELHSAEDAVQRADAKKNRILDLVKGLERKYDLPLLPQTTAMLAIGSLTTESFDILIREVSRDTCDRVLHDSRAQGVRNAIEKWQDATDEVTNFIQDNAPTTLEDRVRQMELVRSAMETSIRTAFSEAGITMPRLSDYAGTISKLGGAIATLGKVLSFVRPTIGG